MEKKHRCKLCFRSFGNGRALGGHMRSHMMKFYAEQKLSEQQEEEEEEDHSFDDFQSVHSYSSTSSPSSSEDEQEEEEEEEEEVKAVASGSDVLQDRESETESFKRNPNCRRSKRVRKSRISDFFGDGFFGKKPKLENECSDEPLSSVSDTSSDEHVAHCLIMLSRDNWNRGEETEHETELQFEQEDDDYSEDSSVEKAIKGNNNNNKVRGKYRCEACNKLFRSYQALGGHRASHKKIKAAAPPPRQNADSGGGSAAPVVAEEKIHQCPFCPRIFSSGQALGGHKRSHFLGGGAITGGSGGAVAPPPEKERSLSIDLNLPAPNDDDVSVSAVSDAEFVHSIKQW